MTRATIGWGFVSQYTTVYCDQQGLAAWFLYRNTLKCIVTRGDKQLGNCIATWATTRPARHAAQRLRHGRLGACDTAPLRPRYGARAPGRACVRKLAQGCALGAPSLFLDSVLFPSHCSDTVHHKNFSEKKIMK